MLHPRHWDALLLERVGRLSPTPVDRWLRRLSTTADHGKLWALIGVVLALQSVRDTGASLLAPRAGRASAST